MNVKIASMAVLLFAAVDWTIPSPARAQAGLQAPGQPIFDCPGIQALATRLRAGLPVQDEWIRRTEAQLRAAEAGVVQSKAELRDAALKAAQAYAVHRLDVLADLRTKLENARGFSSLERHDALMKVEWYKKQGERLEGSLTAGGAGLDLGTAIHQDRASLKELVKFLQESGIADEAAKKTALLLTGPAGELLVESFTVSRDLLYAGLETGMNAHEAALARENLDQMRAARRGVDSRLYELDADYAAGCAPPPPDPTDRILVTSPVDPPAPSAPKARNLGAKTGGGPNPAVLVLGGVAGAAGGLVLAKKISNYVDSQTADCSSQETATTNAVNAMQNALNSLTACGGNSSCYNSRVGAFNSAWSSAANAAGNWCTCLGTSVGSQLSADEKASIRQLWQIAPSMGLNPGALPSCFK